MNTTSFEHLDQAEREALLARAKAAKLQRKGSSQGERIPLRPSVQGPWPLSLAQERLWFVTRTSEEANTALHIIGGLRLRGGLDETALGAALDRILHRHEALRTHFVAVDGEGRQAVDHQLPFVLSRHDLSDVTGAGRRKTETDRLVRAEFEAPFMLDEGPLIRGSLIRLDADEHLLLLTMHHIVSDGWSMEVLVGELGQLYDAYAARGVDRATDPLPALPVQYVDYTLWQREWLRGGVQERQLAYWSERLAGAPELTTLPTDRPRPAVQRFEGRSIPFDLGEELSASLRMLAQKHGVTLYMVALAAWGALVGRLSGQDDVVIGSPVANRGRRELEPLVGFFVNTLALRMDVGDGLSVDELLAQVRETVVQAQGQQDVSFAQVVEAVKPQRSLSHSLIFQVTFAWQSATQEPTAFGGLEVSPVELLDHNAKYDIELGMQESGGRITGRIGYSTSLYDGATVERYLGYLKIVLQAMVTDDTQVVARIDILGDAGRKALDAMQAGTVAPVEACCAHRAFEAHAASQPKAIALEIGEERLGYGELNARANRLARHLVTLGVRPDTRVAVVLERGIDMVVAWLATLKAGGAYVPLDPRYPSDRLAFMLDDSRPRVVLTQAALQDHLPASRALLTASVLELDDPSSPWATLASDNLERPELTPSHLAYVIYTSGSTGQPKGVMVEHRNLVNLVGWHAEQFPLSAGERASCTAGVAFDASTWEVWPTLSMGATLVLAPPDVAADPVRLLDWWQAQSLHVSFLVTALADLALRRGQKDKTDLRSLLIGGDRLAQPPPADLPFTVVNNYGPTEATVVATSGVVDPAEATIHIGRPIANASIYLLDRHGEPVPMGVAGEMYVGGAGVARGYLNRAELTAERFLPDPFAQHADARMYRTGDLARWRNDGTIEFLGRNDDQVKLRGFRIELGEIEAQLRKQPGVREAAVLLREDGGEKRLVAYVVGEAEASALRQVLGMVLPEYMVPAAYVTLEALPLTANGKLDRKALPEPEGEAFAQRAYEAPQGEVEETVARLWSQLLQVEQVGRHDHFFELGGHSLLAVQLIERLRGEGLATDIRTLFAQPTLAGLAAAIERLDTVAVVSEVPPNGIPDGCTAIHPEMLPLVRLSPRQIERIVATVEGGAANIQDIYPLAPLQEGILFHHLLKEQGDPYLTSATLAFDGRERLDRFVMALQQVIDRHDVLRTAILWDGLDEPVQVVSRKVRFHVDTPDLEPGDAVEQLVALIDPKRYRLDVRHAPMIRGIVAYDGQRGQWLLQLMLHHLVLDHTTVDVLFEELALVLAGRADELAADVPFRRFVAQARMEGRADAHEAFFKALLGDVDETTAPYGLDDVKGDGTLVREASVIVAPDLSARLRRQASVSGVSVASLFHWAWARVLAECTGREDVVFGTVLFGRMHGGEGIDRAMGLFINTLPMRLRPYALDARDGIRHTHGLLLELMEHEHAPLSLAQRCSALPTSQPLFTALMNFRHSVVELDGNGLRWDEGIEVLSAQERTNYPFGLSVDDLGTDFKLTTQVALPADAARVLDDVHIALSALADALEHGKTAVSSEPVSRRDFTSSLCIHERFERQVARAPDAIAVSFEGRALRYGELNAQANRLARHLRRLGVGLDDRVAICMRRGLDMVMAILAVLKAGGGYVPMDPAYPESRLAYLLQDSDAKVILTHPEAMDALEGLAPKVPVLDVVGARDAWRVLSANDLPVEEIGLRADHLAYVIYTSGSTGLPKGVMVEHRNVTRLFAATDDWFGFGPGDTWTLFHSYAFDFSVWELWGALLHGGRLVVVPQSTTRSPDAFYRLLCDEGVTVLNQTPSAFRQLVAAQADSDREHSLREVIFGGEALQTASLKPWFSRNGERTRLVNMYGITETTVHVTYRPLTLADVSRRGSPIGVPIPDLSIHILDEEGRPVAPGTVGEMYVGGAGVARGYLDRPELTAQRFVADPFSASEGRLYRTGDLGRQLHDGSFEFAGRNDHQVKIRGFRIELGEIETRLLAQPELREAVVLAREDAVGEKRLIAYVVPRDPDASVDGMALRLRLLRSLPDYMVPAHVVGMAALPLTVHGKLDKDALPSPDDTARSDTGYVAPRDEVESCLASIWAEVLRIDRVGIYDNFFALGGDSMRTIAIVSKARERGVAVSIEQIFRHLTVAGVADAIHADLGLDRGVPSVTAEALLDPADRARLPDGAEDAYPLTSLQLGMVFHNRMSADASVYHDVFSHQVRLDGWNATIFQQALDTVVRKHPILRTSFDLSSYEAPLQIVHAQARCRVVSEDLAHLEVGAQDEYIAHWLDRERSRAFASGEVPMLRVFVHGRGADRFQLTLSFHHAIMDGWSVASFVTELFQGYEALASGQPFAPAMLDCSFRQAVAAEQAMLASPAASGFWKDYLDGHVVGRLPEVGDDEDNALGRTLDIEVPAELVSGLHALARQLHVPTRTVLLAAHMRVMGLFTGEADVTTGMVSHARPAERDGDKVLGLYLNTLPLRLALQPGSWKELIVDTFRSELSVMPYRAYPYARIVQDNGRQALFDTAFNYVNFYVYDGLRALSSLEFLDGSAFEATNHALTFNAALQGEVLSLSLNRDPERVSATLMRRMAHAYGVALRAMVDAPDQAFQHAGLLDEVERDLVLEGFNDTRRAYGDDICLHALFEHQASATPDAMAVRDESRSLTYAELDAQANRLAHHLRTLGVGPDERVAVCLERGVSMVVALLATLKAGGAYVPLDPSYPAERLATMLADSAPRVVLGALPMACEVPVLAMDDAAAWHTASPARPAVAELTPSHLAYVIYTSGSTGQPKGVMNEHRGIVNRLRWMQEAYGLGVDDVVLQKTPFGFDVSVWEFFWPLANGATLVMARPEGHKDPGYLVQAIREHGVTTMHFVPSMLQAFLDGGAVELPSLRRVLCSGEALPGALARRARQALPQAELHNLYGPTEAAVDVTAWHCAEARQPDNVPIGRPIANTAIYLLDRHGEPVPQGVAGEIHIGGVQVARGYLNRPELTAERFVTDPFAGPTDARMYKTGDLGRWRSDGAIEFLGRNDHQVKLRGLRIELGEIEARLLAQPGVREAVVLLREDRLVAYVVGEAASATLREALSRALPEYMLPSAFVSLTALPLTANGKLDRKALPAADGESVIQRTYEAPQGETEVALATLWSELLRVERVGRHDHFFELGGHSLLAVQLMERMRQRALYADIRTLFAKPTLVAFAEAVDAAGATGWKDVEVPPNGIPQGCTAITPDMVPMVSLDAAQIRRIVDAVPGGAANVQDIYPLAPLQEGMLFHHLLQTKGDQYQLSATIAFDTRERLDQFVDALQVVVARHDALRTSLLWEGLPEPVQVVWREARFETRTLVLEGDDIAGRLRAQADPREHRLDLRHAPLLGGLVAFDGENERWLLQLVMHHIVTDHTTLDVMFEEMALIRDDRADELPQPLPFRNFVAQARFGVSTEEHEAFFRTMLGDVDETTAPFGLSDMKGDGSHVDEARLPVDAGLASRLRGQARRLGVSPSSLFHLAWARVLASVCGRDDVVFGTALFGRMRGGTGADRVMGLFMNTLPIRIRIDERSVEQAVRDTHAGLSQLLHHEHAPLLLAQRCSGVPTSSPLFAAGFNFRHSPNVHFVWEGMDVLHGEELSNFPLVLKADDLGDGFLLTANMQRPIDPMRLCRYMHTTLERLAAALEGAPDTTTAALDILPSDERDWLLEGVNDTDTDFAAERCVHALFERHAAATPEAVALVLGERTLTYGELNARANRLAHHLVGLGVKPDVRVAIALPRGFEMIVALLATLKAGGAYVPLDPAYPPDRLAYMLDDSRPRVVLTDTVLQERLPASRALLTANVIELDDPSAPWSRRPDSDPDPIGLGLEASSVAYVIYTSGSTGTPKGVLLEHGGLCNLAAAQVKSFGIDADSRVLQFASFSFDGCIFEVVLALCHGASLHLIASEAPLAGDELRRVLEEQRISHAIVPPAVLATLPDSSVLDGLRTLVMAGDATTQALVRRWGEGRRLINGYGPTEVTVCATTFDCDVGAAGDPPIGGPIANKRVYLLDGRGTPVPADVVGELYIAGAGIARGYLNQPELSAQRFMADPFVGEGRERMYRSGDLGRRRADGRIEFAGRADHQVKIRGFRVELGEIEARLQEVSGVREAVVLVREDDPGQKRLVAYIAASEEASCTPDVLRAHLATSLPEHMVPAAYVRLDAMPLTPNGKLDRRALPTPEDAAFGTRLYDAPEGELEIALAALWSGLLQVARVGRDDHFFELGGHSLLAVQMIARLNQTLGLEAPLADLFAHPTLRQFAEWLGAGASAKIVVDHGTPEPRPANLPVSFAQQRLWFISQLGEEASAAYHIAGGMRLVGALHEAALRAALNRIVQRHEVLRTYFELVDGEPVQRIDAQAGMVLVRHDLAHAVDRQAAVDHWSQVEASTPLDLDQGPLIRGRLLRLDEREHVLLLTLHHVVADGWSMGVLSSELGALYRAYAIDGISHAVDPLPPLPLQYADYAVWQRRWFEGETPQRQLAYWAHQLDGAPALVTLPTDRPRPAVQDYKGSSVDIVLDAELSAGLKRLAQRHGATLYMTMVAAWSALVSRLSGQDEVVIGSPVANRPRIELEPMIGCFINTVAIRLDFADGPDVASLLARAKDVVLQAQTNQDVPFEQVVDIVKPERTMGSGAIFQLMLAWQNMPADPLELGDLRLEDLPSRGDRSTQYDLSLTMWEADGAIRGVMEFATALYDRATVVRHLEHLRRLLLGMVADDTRQIDRIALLDDEGRQIRLAMARGPAQDYPREACAHEVFERHVALASQAIALSHEGLILGYGDLNARANRLARYLRTKGVQPDSRVAICLERGPDMIVAILAVLKAGGAYVPLDPAYPADRLRYMRSDSEPVAVLTRRGLREVLALPDSPSVIDMDGGPRPWDALPEGNLQRARGQTSRSLAYVIYTSGSTGLPKGVMIEHGALCNQVTELRSAYRLGPADRVLQFAAPSFDMSVEEIFGALLSGAALVLATPEWITDARRWSELAATHAITLANLPTLFWQQLAMAPQVSLPSMLRQISIGGEAVGEAALAAWWKRSGHRPALFNAYGPTEATVNASLLACQPSSPPRSIGRPMANMSIHVLDRHGEPVPKGVIGELHIGGACVARGYLGRPELTAERFLPDPFSGDPAARMYRTGDRGRWLPDGSLEFLGRADDQVKIRGFRIEPGEIEVRLLAQPGVEETTVLVREDVPGDKRLVAYVKGSADAVALRRALADVLPEYMLPAAYVQLDAMPTTPNGKLDRRALPAPEEGAYAREAYEAPQGDLETALAEIWMRLLRVPRVGRHDNFFGLGGHSLLAVQLAEQARHRGVHIEVRSLFGAPTVAELARVAKEDDGTRSAPRIPPNRIPPACERLTPDMLTLVDLDADHIERIEAAVPGGARNIQDIYPLAPLQEGILFHHLLQKEEDPYLSSAVFSFDTRERMDGFADALRQVIDRHDALRTAIAWEDLPMPVQVVWRQATFDVDVVSFPEGDTAALLRKHAQSRGLDLRRAPLMRGYAAFDRAGGRWLLLLMEHHLATDHTTLDVMFEEMALIRAGRADDLPEPVPFRDFVARARMGQNAGAHEAFFREMLGDVDEPTAPFGLMDIQGSGADIDEAQGMLDPAISLRIREQARLLGVSAASLFHWAWAQVLAKTTGRDDVVFGSVLFGRMQGGMGADRAMGLFINTLPVRIRLGETDVRDGIRHTHDLLARLLQHEHASLAMAQRCSGLPANLPLFSALLNYRHSPPMETDSALDWEGVALVDGEERSNYPFNLSVDDLGDGFGLNVQVVDSVGASRIVAYVEQTMASLVDALESGVPVPAFRIDVLGAQEQRRMREAWNDTTTARDPERLVHRLFEEHAAADPARTAIVCGDVEVGYGELNARANRMARHLRGMGVGPDIRVATHMERGVAWIVAWLAVQKAGGVYVPLDPDYPVDRRDFMLRDSAPWVLVTDGGSLDGGAWPAERSVVVSGPGADAWDALDGVDLDDGPTASDASYVIYTSGSTGHPKGVLVEHGALGNLALAQGEHLALRGGHRVLQCAAQGFDASVFELTMALCHGGAIYLPAPGTIMAGGALAEAISGHGVTHVTLTPTALATLRRHDDLASVATLVVAGEACPAELVRTWAPGRIFVNAYGPTEATIWSSFHVCDGDATHAPPIGRPIANARIYLLDRHGDPVPVGVAGEIHIGGMGVARGYLGRPELTEARFVPDPFSEGEGARMYRTGDRGRWRSDGTIEFLGRLDHQVKLRGFRIEPGEIEARLLEHPGVREAVVLVRDERLVAYVVGDAQTLALRQALVQVLPEHMVPSAFVALDALPLTPNGKLDRKALPAPDALAHAHRAFEAPEGDAEEALARAWCESLRMGRVGRYDHFFELGGHSLTIVQMVEHLRQRGWQLDMRAVFDRPTLEAMATSMRLAGAEARSRHLVPMHLDGSRRPLFLLHEPTGSILAYRRLIGHLDPDVPVYGLQVDHRDAYVPDTVEELARRYLAIIRSVQPHGPYRLAGWSGGGLLAYEMAHQLLGEDETVEFVGLIDSGRPGYKAMEEMPDENGMLWATLEVYATMRDPNLDMARVRALQAQGGIDEAVVHARRVGWLPEAFTVDELSRRAALFGRLVNACADYRPQSLPAPVHLFTGEPSPGVDPSMGWENLAGEGLRRRTIGGDHKTIMEEPHIRSLATEIMRALDQAEASPTPRPPRDKAAITLQSGQKAGAPVFCLPGAGANVTCFLPLLDALGGKVHVIGLQSRGHDGEAVPHMSVQAAARAYLQEVKAVLPCGPYRFMGHSFGGWIAFEMARQLEQEGKHVDTTILVDSEPPGSVRRSDRLRTLSLFVELLEMERGTRLPLRMDELRTLDDEKRIDHLLAGLVEGGILPPRTPIQKLHGLLRVFGTHLNTGYQPESGYGGKVLLVNAEPAEPSSTRRKKPLTNQEKQAIWQRHAADTDLRTLQGSNHMTVLRPPHVARLAAALDELWSLHATSSISSHPFHTEPR